MRIGCNDLEAVVIIMIIAESRLVRKKVSGLTSAQETVLILRQKPFRRKVMEKPKFVTRRSQRNRVMK